MIPKSREGHDGRDGRENFFYILRQDHPKSREYPYSYSGTQNKNTDRKCDIAPLGERRQEVY